MKRSAKALAIIPLLLGASAFSAATDAGPRPAWDNPAVIRVGTEPIRATSLSGTGEGLFSVGGFIAYSLSCAPSLPRRYPASPLL
ncbi:MAG TPA: hypothetical protein VGD81_01755 [Opitutaceae bacterium]